MGLGTLGEGLGFWGGLGELKEEGSGFWVQLEGNLSHLGGELGD